MGRNQPDREKYFKIAREQSLRQALTLLHEELRELEHETFEGASGWKQELYEDMKAYRALSVELWDQRYDLEPIFQQQFTENKPT